MQDEIVAFLGLGTMGGAMAENLLRAGYSVQGYNRSAGRREALAARVPADMRLRLTLHANVSDAVAGAQAVIVCLSDDNALREVLFEEPNLFSVVSQEAILIDCGTTSQSLTHEIAARAQAKGLGFIDAPMTGSMLGAQRKTLTFMAGGSEDAFVRARPMLEAMGGYIVHVGTRIGDGQSAKYCLNMTQAVVLQGVLEGYALARKLDVPMEKMAEIFEHSAGKTGVGSFKTPYLEAGDYHPHFRLDLMQKDLHLALDQASQRRLPLPAAQAVRVLYDQGVAEGLGARDFLVLAKLMERWGHFSYADPAKGESQ